MYSKIFLFLFPTSFYILTHVLHQLKKINEKVLIPGYKKLGIRYEYFFQAISTAVIF